MIDVNDIDTKNRWLIPILSQRFWNIHDGGIGWFYRYNCL